jgi:hypothetical protein
MPITLDGTNGLTFPDGSNTVPVVKGTTSGNTSGIIFPAANTVAFVTSGVERARFDSDGDLGIGTSSPATKLNIYSSTAQTDNIGFVQIENPTAANAVNASYTAKNYSGTSQFMQWENYGLRIGSRIKTNSGAGGVYFTYGNDSVGMTMDGSGRVTKSSQPYLRAVTSTSAQSLTGGTTYVIPFNVISYQTGSNYNNSTYRFTCPVAGQYFVSASVQGSSISSNYYNLFLRINGSGFAGTYVTGRNSAYEQLSTTGIIAASAGDYIDVGLYVNQTGGNLELNPGDIRNSLHIYLLG